jgi:hypothetical protein
MTAPETTVFNASNLGNYPPGVSAWAALQIPLRQETFTNLGAADDDGIKTAIASVASTVTYSGSALNGAIGAGAISPPRNITVTTAGVTPADAPATATITGLAIDGSAQTDSITISQTAATAAGTKAFASVTSIALTAGDGTGATLAFGTGNVVGLDSKLRDVGGVAGILKEVANATVVTNGVFVLPATSGPFGTYSPNSAPNGTNDYAILYAVGA